MKMMKTGLAATTALCLSMAPALAGDDNFSAIDQQGDNNTASVTQSGSRNDAGRALDDMLQSGTGNSLTIEQTGDDNQVGASAAAAFGGWTNRGVEQHGTNNSATVMQSGPFAVINELYQDTNGASGGTNTLSITQSASSPNNDGSIGFANVISRVEQINTGSAQNRVTISQDRSTDGELGNNYGRNVIGDRRGADGAYATREGNIENGVRQDGSGNTADLTQVGDRNAITQVHQTGDGNNATVSQDNTGSGARGDFNLVHNIRQDSAGHATGNTANIVQDGLRNGQPAFALGSYAGMAGATERVVKQIGGGNDVDYLVTGNDNGFGFDQNGTNNSVGTITVTGNGNDLGVRQDGTTNILALGDIAGDDNDVGVLQIGTNRAEIKLWDPLGINTSDDNDVWVDQNGTNTAATIAINGDLNLALLEQDGSNSADIAIKGDSNMIETRQGLYAGSGGTNSADIDVTGNSNMADLRQWGDNTATLNITGDFNNNSGSTVWGGAAASVSGLTTVGLMEQIGNGNSLDVTVSGSNDNLWATRQDGTNNKIVAMVSGGDGNQFGVIQTNSGNLANVTQTGNGNNAGVSQ